MFHSFSLNIFGVIGVIYPFTLLMGLGFAHLFLGFTWAAKDKNIVYSEVEKVQMILVASLIIGFFFAALSSQILISENVRITTITVMPGFFAGSLFLIFTIKIYKLDVIRWINFLIPYWCFAHGWGRIGCFMGGCCYGKPTDNMLGIIFPPESMPYIEHGAQKLHPTQLYEAFMLFFTGCFLLKVNYFYRYRISIFLIVYGTTRFFIEFLRDDLRGEIGSLSLISPSQLFSIVFIFLGIIYLIFLRKPDSKIL